jgi:hypothetical protein
MKKNVDNLLPVPIRVGGENIERYSFHLVPHVHFGECLQRCYYELCGFMFWELDGTFAI